MKMDNLCEKLISPNGFENAIHNTDLNYFLFSLFGSIGRMNSNDFNFIETNEK